MKVVIVTSAHPITDVRIFHKQALDLASAGHDVVVVGCRDIPACCGDAKECMYKSVKLRIVPAPRSRLHRMSIGVVRIFSAAVNEEGDVYHLHDPELLPIGALLSARGRTVVFDAHESLSRSILTKSWVPGPLRGVLSRLVRLGEGMMTSRLTAVVAATPSIAQESGNRETLVVQNFPRRDEFICDTTLQYEYRPECVVYVGGFSRLRGALEMVRAVGLVAERRPIEFILAGQTRDADLLDEMRRTKGWSRTNFVGWQGRNEMARLMGRARAGLVLFQPAPNHLEAQPNKMFEYMAAGLPVIASDFPLWREIVEGSRCGLLVDPSDPKQIAQVVLWILEHPSEAKRMGERGRAAVNSTYNWEAESAKLTSFYRNLPALRANSRSAPLASR